MRATSLKAGVRFGHVPLAVFIDESYSLFTIYCMRSPYGKNQPLIWFVADSHVSIILCTPVRNG